MNAETNSEIETLDLKIERLQSDLRMHQRIRERAENRVAELTVEIGKLGDERAKLQTPSLFK